MRKGFEDSYHRNWLLYAGLTASAVYLPIILVNGDVSELLYWLAVLTVVSIDFLVAFAFLFTGGWKTAMSLFTVGLVYIVSSFTLLNAQSIRTAARWGFHAADYKRQVFAQADPARSGYRHIEWDGWGWGGNDTVQYLVYDPRNIISAAGGNAIMMHGTPCVVASVRRLEKTWYLVTFRTDEDWTSCR